MLQEHSYSKSAWANTRSILHDQIVLIIYVIWPKFIEREQSFATEKEPVAAKRIGLRMGFFILFCFV